MPNGKVNCLSYDAKSFAAASLFVKSNVGVIGFGVAVEVSLAISTTIFFYKSNKYQLMNLSSMKGISVFFCK